MSDASQSYNQITPEMADADRSKNDVQKEKGVTGINAAALVLFWPAMIGTYLNANEAIAAADACKVNLMGLYKQKKCR